MGSVWRSAASITDLGKAMGDWLEGRTVSRPGYEQGYSVDGETSHLVPTLAAVNRAGYLTDSSQPGESGTAYDGRPYRQRAGVTGHIAAGDPLLRSLMDGARSAGITVVAKGPGVSVGSRHGMVVTEWGGEPYTGFGAVTSRRQTDAIWDGVGRSARQHLLKGVALTLVDPVWGRDTVLWPLLARVAR